MRSIKPTRRATKPLPPRLPLPHVTFPKEGARQAEEPPMRKRVPRPIGAVLRLLALAIVIALAIWAWDQPFFRPVAEAAEALIRRGVDYVRARIGGG